MTDTRYTGADVKDAVEADLERLTSSWTAGRPETWSPCPDTLRLIGAGKWLEEQLRTLCQSDDDRRTQLWKFNRLSRTYDVWDTAAECLNDVLDGHVEQNRRGHRRWG